MKYIGAHISINDGIMTVPLKAKKIGAKSFACFTKNQRTWKSKQYKQVDIDLFKTNLVLSEINESMILAHASYLINLASPHEHVRKKSYIALLDEIKICDQLGIKNIVLHLGSCLKLINEYISLDYLALAINDIFKSITSDITILMENSAGQGGSIGYKFSHLSYLISKIINKKKIGIVIDTCHLFAAGYDFSNKNKYEILWADFDKFIGLEYLKGIHLNDSKGKLGCKVDRHESIGNGEIGICTFEFFIKDDRLDNIPIILETPDSNLWEKEINFLYNIYNKY